MADKIDVARLVQEAEIAAQRDVEVLREPCRWFLLRDEHFARLVMEECAVICERENVSILSIDPERGPFTIQDMATRSCGEELAKKIRARMP